MNAPVLSIPLLETLAYVAKYSNETDFPQDSLAHDSYCFIS